MVLQKKNIIYLGARRGDGGLNRVVPAGYEYFYFAILEKRCTFAVANSGYRSKWQPTGLV